MPLTLTSPAFRNNGPIPEEYTCDGANAPPPLEWSGAPAGTRRFALIVDDPDAPDPNAPQQIYVHWVLYDIPPAVDVLVAGGSGLPEGAHEGTNDFNRRGYGGPCPPVGRHRYFFKLYAVNTTLGAKGALTKAELEAELHEHVIEKTELVGNARSRRAGKRARNAPRERGHGRLCVRWAGKAGRPRVRAPWRVRLARRPGALVRRLASGSLAVDRHSANGICRARHVDASSRVEIVACIFHSHVYPEHQFQRRVRQLGGWVIPGYT